jgi:hypothetical protein
MSKPTKYPQGVKVNTRDEVRAAKAEHEAKIAAAERKAEASRAKAAEDARRRIADARKGRW